MLSYLTTISEQSNYPCRSPLFECGRGAGAATDSKSLHRLGSDSAMMYSEVDILNQIDDTVESVHNDEFGDNYSGLNETISANHANASDHTND